MLKIRRPLGRLIFNMGIAIPGKTVFLIETAPWWLTRDLFHLQSISLYPKRKWIFIFVDTCALLMPVDKRIIHLMKPHINQVKKYIPLPQTHSHLIVLCPISILNRIRLHISSALIYKLFLKLLKRWVMNYWKICTVLSDKSTLFVHNLIFHQNKFDIIRFAYSIRLLANCIGPYQW